MKDILSEEINEKEDYLRRGMESRFSNAEVTALSLLGECLSIDNENYLFSLNVKAELNILWQINSTNVFH